MDKLIAQLLDGGVYLSVEQERLKVKYNGDLMPDELLQQIKKNKFELIAYLKATESHTDYQDIGLVSGRGPFKLSSAQRRLWVLSQFEGGSTAYNIPVSVYLNQEIEIESFKRAIDATVSRHEILRTVFREDETGQIRQWVLGREALGFAIDYRDLRGDANGKKKVAAYIGEDAYRSFDLEKGPLLRAALLQVEEEGYVFYFNMHHIISDGWSMEVLSKDVLHYYEAYRAGKEPELEELRIQYKDYAAWQSAQLDKETYMAHKAYWLDQLSGELPLLDLPTNKKRPNVKTYNGCSLTAWLDKATTAKLKGYTQEKGGSLFMGLLASWNVLLYRYTSQQDIIIGTPVAGREHADLEDQIGFYVNTVVLRNEVDGEESFNRFYQGLKEGTLKSYSHQLYPFDRLVEELDLQRDTSRSAVFDVLVTLQNNGKKIGGVRLSEGVLNQIDDQGYKRSKFDIAVTFQEIGDYLSMNVVFNPDVYEKAMIEGLIRHYKQLLFALLATPEEKISQMDYLSEREKHELLVTFNDTAVAYPKDKTIVDLFEEQVARTPDNVAIVFEDRELTYRELDERSNQLAHYLSDNYDIQPDDLIGIQLNRSEWMIVSILGILKAGGAYVPIDPEYPQERIDYIQQDTRSKVCLDERELSKFKAGQERYSREPVTSTAESDNLIYVMYTSGSTGEPKGVMLEHSGLVNRMLWMKRDLSVTETDVFLQKTPVTFDVSVWELFVPLVCGSKLVFARPEGHKDPIYLDKVLETQKISIVHFVPSMLGAALGTIKWDRLESLRHVVCSGEALPKRVEELFKEKAPFPSLHNYYGPTEASIEVTAMDLSQYPTTGNDVSIGKPVANTSIYIVNEKDDLQPVGVSGEILIGGDQVARGYLNREALTKEKFIASPFKAGERLYRTGDLGRWLPDGNIAFMGRKDDQVKIRGYRIEPREIEHALLSHEEINEAVVVARANQSGEKELVAYITSRTDQNARDLRAWLEGTLPAYMVPAYFVQLEAMPLTANGKIDKGSLPDPAGQGLSGSAGYVAARNETEAKLVKIWEEVLQRENIGVHDDFFVLGGHSLKAVRLSNAYQKELAVKMPLKELFAHTSIASQAALIASSTQGIFIQIEKVALQASYPISDGQRRLWVLSQFEGGSAAYNIPGSLKLNGKYEPALFERSFDSLIERHEILRTVFREDATGEIRQWVLGREALGFAIDYRDLSGDANGKEKAAAYIAEDTYRSFDLARGPLLRAALLRIKEEGYIFCFNMHHIISDGWSMEVLSKDVLHYYEAYRAGKEPGLEELRIQYKDYSAWQSAQLDQETYKTHKAYWLDQLSGELPLLDLPTSKQRPKVKTYNGYSLTAWLDKATTAKLKEYTQEKGGSLFMGLLASWNVLLYRYTSQQDILIGTPVAGREHADLEDQIGFYVNTLVLRNEVDPEESFNRFYQGLKEGTLKSYSHQMYPFDRLVEELDLQRDTSRSAVFDVLVTLQNNGEKIEGVTLSKEELDQTVDRGYRRSKFDIAVTFQETGDYLSLNVVFNPDVYEKVMIEGLIRHYKQLLSGLLATPEEKISQVEYLSPQEKHELLVTFNDRAVAYPKDKTIVDLFEEQVARTPDNVAIVFEDRELTYRELDERSNQLAHYLREQGVLEETLVPICVERGVEMLIGVLSILKAGGAYVPIDPSYPHERISYMLADTAAQLVVSTRETEQALPGDYAGRQVVVDRDWVLISQQPTARPVTELCPTNLAYVIYTSGSTGKPKGVLIQHSNVVRLFYNEAPLYDFNERDTWTLFHSFSFDFSVWEMFGALFYGGRLVIVPKWITQDVNAFSDLLVEREVTVLNQTPSAFYVLLGCVSGKVKQLPLRYVIFGGEALNPAKIKPWKEQFPGCRLVNMYGITETTVHVSYQEIDFEQLNTDSSLIGKAIPTLAIFILDRVQQVVPVGVIGEMYISGAGLARGYLNQPALTAEKFIGSPFKAGERLYKTGDLGRWLSDGNIEFIGRIDDQVKIRGYRIEPGEIEHALLSHAAINEAVVLARANQSGEKELVAYITSGADQNTRDLRAWLEGMLPAYMVPAYFVQLEAMPLTANGKIDKRSLPDPAGQGLSSGAAYVAPGTEQEKVLAAVWSDVLKRADIGIKESFFNLGGDSIKSIQVVARLRQRGYRLKVEHLLRTPVLAELAGLLEPAVRVTDQSEVSGEVVLTPIQEWFFKSAEIKRPDHFNQSVLLYSREELDSGILERSIEELTRHHDALRMVYRQTSGGWRQFNQDTRSRRYSIDFHDLRGSDDAPGQIARLGAVLQSGINLAEGPLLRVAHFRLADGDRLGLIIHHLVVDGVSWRILLEDLSDLYRGYKEGKKVVLPLKTDSFQRWALLQKEYAGGKKLSTERDYWQEVCGQAAPKLPQDKAVGAEEAAVIDAVESFRLDKPTTEALQTRVHGVYRTEINDVLLTGLGLALKEVLSAEKSVLKVEGHGREEILEGVDISRTVGWFTTVYPFVLDVSKNPSDKTASLVAVKEGLRRVPDKGIGYGMLTHLSPEGLESRLTPEITFNYLGDFGSNVSNAEGSLFEYASERLGPDIPKENRMEALLDVSGMLVKGELGMSIRYSKSRYDAATIKKLAASYKKNLQVLIETLSGTDTTYLTPSDLSFKGLSQEEVSGLNSDNTLEDVYELSPLQEGIYYHWLAEPSGTLYFEQTSYRVRANVLDIEKLKGAYDRLTARHAILRTSFSTGYAGRSLQIVRKEVSSNFTYEKLDSQADRQAQVERIRQQDRERGFDLSRGSQMRLHVIDLSEGEYEFIWSHHHILMDGWCVSVLINDFNELLSGAMTGREVKLPPALPYAGYINWLRTLDRDSSLGYWKQYLSGYSAVAAIPFKAATGDTTYVESREHLQIRGGLFKKVDALCTQTGITQNTFVQGVWGYLLSRYNNSNDVVFGAVVSGRPADLAGVEDMIGLFINTIPVRVKYDGDDTPVKLLKSLHEQSIQSTPHHYMNLSEVQSQSELGMELIDHIMIFENYAVKELESEGALNGRGDEGLSVESMEVFERTNYDFNVTVSPSDVSLGINIKYNINSYDQLSLKNLIRHFDKLVHEFAYNANQSLRTFDYLSEEEKHELLVTFNDTTVAYSKDKTIVDLFEEQVAKTPDNIALVFTEKKMTYRQLNEKSNQLAAHLQKNYKIRPNDLIGIHLNRSEWMIVSILGVLKAGGAYVPIDPEYPSSRKEYIINDTSLHLLITEANFIYDIDYYQGEVFAIDVKFDAENYHSEALSKTYTPGNLAYVIYTSGSTGMPKGVMVEHNSLTNYLKWGRSKYSNDSSALNFGLFTSLSFDLTVTSIYLPLISGGELTIFNSTADVSTLVKEYFESEINCIKLTPAHVGLLGQLGLKSAKVQVAIIGGDKLEDAHVGILRELNPAIRIYNEYGPTESTVGCTIKEIGFEKEAILIGCPISNTQIYILNENEDLQPVGVAGEIFIGGNGLAKGYLNQPALTAEKFIASPFKAGERLYKTGDLGRWLPDGNIAFIGRKDDQVKIRGYRIEPGEIEHALLSHEEIKEAVVLARENGSGQTELVAYITSNTDQNTSDLRAYLEGTLPAYMVPTYFVQLGAMPLTANGKIDKGLLPDPAGLGLSSGAEYIAPRNEIEEKLAKIWEEVLQRGNIGVKDNFFALGGHSLRALKVMFKVNEEFNIGVKIANLFNTPSIEDFAILIAFILNRKKNKIKSKEVEL